MIDELIDPPSVKSGNALQRRVVMSDERLLWHLFPLTWEHINLTGDSVWQQNRPHTPGKFRPLRMPTMTELGVQFHATPKSPAAL